MEEASVQGQERTIGSLLSEAVATLEELRESSLPTCEAAYQGKVQSALRLLLQCQALVARGEVYSANEGLDEFSAERLRFLLVPSYLAEAAQLVCGDEKRGGNLLFAKAQLLQFLGEMDRLALLTAADQRAWKRGGAAVAPKDAATRRDEKLERGRREMANKKRLREIRAKIAENEKRGLDERTDIDEELFRESVLLEIQVAVKNALEGVDLIEQELPLVERMAHLKKLEAATAGKSWQEPKKETARVAEPVKVELPPGYTQTVGSAGQITIAKAPMLRAELEKQVFRPGYNMATMSVEEAGERDYQEMLERTEREKISAARKAAEPDEDDASHYDTVTVYKDRSWDAFKDDNPTGSGNTTGNLG